MTTDPRITALQDIVFNLEETPADQDPDFLAQASNLAARIKGLADTEMLSRALEPVATEDNCPGSGQLAKVGDGSPMCPVCRRRKSIGLPTRFPRNQPKTVTVPTHEARPR